MSDCRWPEKQRHQSRKAALQAIAAMYASGKGNPDLGAYQCGNHWHVGHELAHFKQRIRRSLRGGRGPKTLYARSRRTKQ